MDGQDDIYSQKTILLMHLHVGRLGICPALAMKYCVIMVYFSFMLLWERVVLIPAEDSLHKWHQGSASEACLHWNMEWVTSVVRAVLLPYGGSCSRKCVCLFLTACLEVQNKLKKITYTKKYVLLK